MKLKLNNDYTITSDASCYMLNNPEYCKHGYVAMGTKKRLDLDANLLR